MFGELMSNLEQQKSDMQNNLRNILVEESMEGIVITGNATKEITNLSINKTLFSNGDAEMLEDLLLSCFNRFIQKASKAEDIEAKKLMESMIPPGFGELFK